MSRRLARMAAAWATLVGVVITVGTAHPTAGSSNVSRLPLHVLLTVSTNLSAAARGTLISEAERIWRPEHVEIEWVRPGRTIEHLDAPLRVLVVTRPQPTIQAAGSWPVAELLPEAMPRAIAIASIGGAQRVVEEAARSARPNTKPSTDYRLGLVLGRAVAHEIGHFLLSTSTHAESGLMRASIDAREFAALGGENFRLDRDASRWLRQHLMTSPGVTTPRVVGFSYARHTTDSAPLTLPDALLQVSPTR